MPSILAKLRTTSGNFQRCSLNGEYVERIPGNLELEEGTMTLYGSTGIGYRSPALNVPGYGWVPCSRKLCNDFTNKSSLLMIVHSTGYVTSDIWVTRIG